MSGLEYWLEQEMMQFDQELQQRMSKFQSRMMEANERHVKGISDSCGEMPKGWLARRRWNKDFDAKLELNRVDENKDQLVEMRNMDQFWLDRLGAIADELEIRIEQAGEREVTRLVQELRDNTQKTLSEVTARTNMTDAERWRRSMA